MFLKNIVKEIPVDLNLIDTPTKNSPSTTITPTVSKLENYINKKYNETAESRNKNEILLKLQKQFLHPVKKSELLQSLKKLIFYCNSEITSLRDELKENDYAGRTLL